MDVEGQTQSFCLGFSGSLDARPDSTKWIGSGTTDAYNVVKMDMVTTDCLNAKHTKD